MSGLYLGAAVVVLLLRREICAFFAAAKAGGLEFGENICGKGNSLSFGSKIFVNDTKASKLSIIWQLRLESPRMTKKSVSGIYFRVKTFEDCFSR